MSLVINALIGLANISTVAVSGFMKVPQIYSLLKSKSPEGVSLQSLLLELTGYLIVMSYNLYAKYPLASYFEYPLLVIQDIIMLAIMIQLLDLYSSSLFVPILGAMGLVVGISWGYLPSALITILVSLVTPLSASSKVVQLRSIIAKKDSTGVSIITWLISSYTCITRLFTIYVESLDVPLMCNFLVSLILNLGIVVATVTYAPEPMEKQKKQE